MALSPIGNVTYINQNAQLGSIQHANNTQRADVALNANMQDFANKLKDVQEVQKPPQIEAIDPDEKQESKDNKEQEQNKQAKEPLQTTESSLESELDTSAEKHLLDIRV